MYQLTNYVSLFELREVIEQLEKNGDEPAKDYFILNGLEARGKGLDVDDEDLEGFAIYTLGKRAAHSMRMKLAQKRAEITYLEEVLKEVQKNIAV